MTQKNSFRSFTSRTVRHVRHVCADDRQNVMNPVRRGKESLKKTHVKQTVRKKQAQKASFHRYLKILSWFLKKKKKKNFYEYRTRMNWTQTSCKSKHTVFTSIVPTINAFAQNAGLSSSAHRKRFWCHTSFPFHNLISYTHVSSRMTSMTSP